MLLNKEFIDKLDSEDLWRLFGLVKEELYHRGLVRTKNMVGERGEYIAVEYYSNTPTLQNLQKALEGTQNIDAISRKGERYSIKTITFPNKITGVFHGMGDRDADIEKIKQKFEFVIVVVLNSDFTPRHIYEFTWANFLHIRRWHKTMRAWNICLTKKTLSFAKVIYSST